MKIAVINGYEKKGVTYNLKEAFLHEFEDGEVEEFYLPADLSNFCVGCTACFLRGEEHCKDRAQVEKIESALKAADLIVFAYPVYVFHAPSSVKNLLDHMGYRWIVHRPCGKMFSKRAVIITQCLGAGAKSAVKDVKDSLSWWGIPYIKSFKGAIRDKDIVWDNISEKRRKALLDSMKKLALKIKKEDFSKAPVTSPLTKMKFMIVRQMQKSIASSGSPSADSNYWKENGWLEDKRPWKN